MPRHVSSPEKRARTDQLTLETPSRYAPLAAAPAPERMRARPPAEHTASLPSLCPYPPTRQASRGSAVAPAPPQAPPSMAALPVPPPAPGRGGGAGRRRACLPTPPHPSAPAAPHAPPRAARCATFVAHSAAGHAVLMPPETLWCPYTACGKPHTLSSLIPTDTRTCFPSRAPVGSHSDRRRRSRSRSSRRRRRRRPLCDSATEPWPSLLPPF